MERSRWTSLRRRTAALVTAAGTLWCAAVTAHSDTLSSALAALRSSTGLPLSLLRWELGDWRQTDGLSPATALTISQSPLLLSARQQVAQLWSHETRDAEEAPDQPDASAVPDPVTTPLTETPLDAGLDLTDNGIPARTLVPNGTAGYTVAGRVYISNSTSHTLNVQELDGGFSSRLQDGGPQILILHTHGSEAYTPPSGVSVSYSGDHRTTDTRYNVVRVGDEMAQVFAAAGISVLHDRTLYDYPSYSGAYDRALAAIESDLAEYPSLSFILDVHRDAIEDTEGNEYKVVSVIDGVGTAAQLTVVVGSDGSGLTHPSWMENLKLGTAVQSQLLQRYPTLMRPLLLRNSRYNQHACPGSLLLEVGAAGNSPDEAVLAGRLFAQTLAQLLQDASK